MANRTQDDKKRAAALAALDHLPAGEVIGVGTGSTTDHFIAALHGIRRRIDGAVTTSEASATRLEAAGIRVLDLNAVGGLAVYVDGADEATRHRHLVKGGGGALTREKVVAGVAERFICIVDDSKLVARLGRRPLAVEVLPFARSHVAREMVRHKGRPVLREGFRTEHGNFILDVHGLEVTAPVALESEFNHIPGAVTNGLFARRPADLLLVADERGVSAI